MEIFIIKCLIKKFRYQDIILLFSIITPINFFKIIHNFIYLSLGLQNVHVEGDCKVIVDAINSQSACITAFGDIVDVCRIVG